MVQTSGNSQAVVQSDDSVVLLSYLEVDGAMSNSHYEFRSDSLEYGRY